MMTPPRGKIVIYGLLEAGSTQMPWFPLLDKSLSIVGYTILDFFESDTRRTSPEPEKIDAAVAFLSARLASGALVPVIARTFPTRGNRRSAPVHGVEPADRQASPWPTR